MTDALTLVTKIYRAVNFLYTLLLLLMIFLTSCEENPDIGTGTTALPVVSLEQLDVQEGNADKAVFASVRLSRSSDETVTILVETSDGTAEEGSDYLAVSESIDFAPGATQANVRLEILGDEESEVDEKFTLSITDVNGATIGNGSIEITIENDDLGSGTVAIPSAGYSTPLEYPSMQMIWNDEFNSEVLNEAFWTYELGNGDWGWGNNELQFYKKENTFLVDGYLVIQALKENHLGYDYTSSRIKTQGKFNFTHGRVDIRASLPEGQGVWPALWMLGESITQVSWPRCGEIDIMEILGQEPSTLHGTVHYSNTNGDHLLNGKSYDLSGGKKFSDEFYVFSIVWEEDKIDFYVNDIKYHTVTPQSLGSQNPYPFNDDFFFIFNVACGGNWPGSPDASTSFPQNMIVDYIRVFQNN